MHERDDAGRGAPEAIRLYEFRDVKLNAARDNCEARPKDAGIRTEIRGPASRKRSWRDTVWRRGHPALLGQLGDAKANLAAERQPDSTLENYGLTSVYGDDLFDPVQIHYRGAMDSRETQRVQLPFEAADRLAHPLDPPVTQVYEGGSNVRFDPFDLLHVDETYSFACPHYKTVRVAAIGPEVGDQARQLSQEKTQLILILHLFGHGFGLVLGAEAHRPPRVRFLGIVGRGRVFQVIIRSGVGSAPQGHVGTIPAAADPGRTYFVLDWPLSDLDADPSLTIRLPLDSEIIRAGTLPLPRQVNERMRFSRTTP